MLELFGAEYVTQHIMQTAKAESDERLYRTYVTDSLQAIANNIGKAIGGTTVNKRFYDIVYKKPVKESRTAEEIIEHMKDVLREAGGGENESI